MTRIMRNANILKFTQVYAPHDINMNKPFSKNVPTFKDQVILNDFMIQHLLSLIRSLKTLDMALKDTTIRHSCVVPAMYASMNIVNACKCITYT